MSKFTVMYKSTNSMYLNVEADSLEEAKETAENTDGGEFINAGSCDWEYDYTEDENGNVLITGNNDFLREQLKELQADLLDMSDKELVECRSLLLERINWCMTAILEKTMNLEEIKVNEELKKFAEKYNWELEVWHGEYRGVLCGVQNTNPGEEPLPLYRFPDGVSLA